MSALQIKCYLLPSSSSNDETSGPNTELISKSSEIRRFALAQPSSGVGFYNALVQKMQEAFGPTILPSTQRHEEIKTYWLDEELDLVCFSTDIELQYAVDSQTALRLNGGENSNGLFKVYVMRKELTDKEKRREMRRRCGEWWSKMRDESSSERKKCMFAESMMSSGDEESSKKACHPGVICDGCRKGIFGLRYKCNTCADFDLCSTCKDSGSIHVDHEFRKIEKPLMRHGPWSMGCRGPRHGFGHWRQQFMNKQREQQQQQSTNPLQETLKHFMPHIAGTIPVVSDPEQLKNFGESLKQFLDPFGIDVSYYVDNLNAGCAKNETVPKKEENANSQTEVKPKEDAKVDSKTTAANDLIDLKPTMEAKTMSSELAHASAPKQEIEKPSSEKIPTIKANDLSLPKREEDYQGFNLIDMEKEMRYMNCIEHLKSMGYTDDAGWLSRLVIAKDGNINNILDSLQPTKN